MGQTDSDGLCENGDGTLDTLHSFFPDAQFAHFLFATQLWWLVWLLWFLSAFSVCIWLGWTTPAWAVSITQLVIGANAVTATLCFRALVAFLAAANLCCVFGLALKQDLLDNTALVELQRSFLQSTDLKDVRELGKRVLYLMPVVAIFFVLVEVFAFTAITGFQVSPWPLLSYGLGVVLPFHVVALSSAFSLLFVTWRVSTHAIDNTLKGLEDHLTKAKQNSKYIHVGFWPEMSSKISVLDDLMTHSWRAVAKLLLMFGFGISIVVITAGLLAFAAFRNGRDQASCLILGFAGSACGLVLWILVPLAKVTEMCQSMQADVRSIAKCVTMFATIAWPQETRIELVLFIMHLDRLKLGVEIPLLGTVDFAFLASKASVLVTIVPLILSMFAGIFSHDK